MFKRVSFQIFRGEECRVALITSRDIYLPEQILMYSPPLSLLLLLYEKIAFFTLNLDSLG